MNKGENGPNVSKPNFTDENVTSKNGGLKDSPCVFRMRITGNTTELNQLVKQETAMGLVKNLLSPAASRDTDDEGR